MTLWAAAVVAAGCDESFTPLASKELQYSVFGYLDPAADTQWIRVMPIRDLVPTERDSFPGTVSLEHLGTGQLIALRDSVFRFEQHGDPEIGSQGLFLHNFWTTERIQTGASYRLTVKRPGEETAEALVEIPGTFQAEVWLKQPWARGTDSLRLTGVRHVPFARATSYFYDRCGNFSEPVSFKAPKGTADVQAVSVNKVSLTARQGCGPMFPEKRMLWAVASGAPWPEGQGYSASGLVPWEGPSNISHSLGFLAGVLTTAVPYENCDLTGPAPLPDFCRLKYDSTTALVSGLITETRCAAGPFDTLAVRLTELKPGGVVRRIRSTRTNRAGRYEIAGLEPGVRHLLTIAPPTTPGMFGPEDRYTNHIDTLVFTPGERRQYHIGLRRLDECWIVW